MEAKTPKQTNIPTGCLPQRSSVYLETHPNTPYVPALQNSREVYSSSVPDLQLTKNVNKKNLLHRVRSNACVGPHPRTSPLRRTDKELQAAGRSSFFVCNLRFKEAIDSEVTACDGATRKKTTELERLMDGNNTFPEVSVKYCFTII